MRNSGASASSRGTEHGRGRLILVSNRLPLSFRREKGKLKAAPSSGGLIGALEPVLQHYGGTWVGSAGTEDTPELHRLLRVASRNRSFHYHPIILTEEEQAKYYEGFANEVLWPLFHDLQSRCVFNPEYWDFYRSVNLKFAQAIESISAAHDVIWIQDYQLMQVARGIRGKRPDLLLSFFLHIPFPSPDIFGKLPWRRELLEDLLQYDFVGLQTVRDERNLIASIRTFIPQATITGRADHHSVTTGRGTVQVCAIPISVDFAEISKAAAMSVVDDRVRELRGEEHSLRLAIGVDRLDYTKGIPERLRALRVFFRTCPQFRRRVALIQIVVPSRESIPGYQHLRSQIEELISSVNGEFAEPGWTPIQFIYRAISREELLALYRAAGIALITPLKDGMNLVAKEYCAAHIHSDGILILSEFAGAITELRTGAISVHPYDELGIAAALRQAMEMPVLERRQRMIRMRRIIQKHDIEWWRNRIFEEIRQLGFAAELAA